MNNHRGHAFSRGLGFRKRPSELVSTTRSMAVGASVDFGRYGVRLRFRLADRGVAKASALAARKIDPGFVGLRPPAAGRNMVALAWECIAHHKIVVVLPSHHALTKRSKLGLEDLKSLFFVAMSEKTHPGSRDWLCALCQQAGFTPRILQDVELESGLMSFVAEGLGVTLAREQIKHLPHPGVTFRPLTASAKADYRIAWHRENRSKALRQCIEIVKVQAMTPR